jgi:hypothetical protein
MRVFDFYGRDVGESLAAAYVHTPAVIPAGFRGYRAVLTGFYQTRIEQIAPVVLTADGGVCQSISVWLAHAWPNMQTVKGVSTGRSDYSIAELFRPQAEIPLGGGSKIGPDGPPDAFFVVGDYQGLPVRSDVARVGLFSSDMVLQPEFTLVPVGGATPAEPTPQPPPDPSSNEAALLADNLVSIAARVRNLA